MNWERRGVLGTHYPPSRQGAARYITGENAREIAFLAALTDAGVKPSALAGSTVHWPSHWAAVSLQDLPEAFAFNRRCPARGQPAGLDMTIGALKSVLSDRTAAWAGDEPEVSTPTSVAIIDPQAIARAVDLWVEANASSAPDGGKRLLRDEVLADG